MLTDISDIAAVLAILAVAVTLFVLELARMDVVALCVLVTLGASGLLTPQEALSGFSHPAVIAVLGVFIMSTGLEKTGVTEALGRLLQRAAGRSERSLMAWIMMVVACLSSFMSNVAATAVLLPAVMQVSGRTGIAPSRLLMPLAYGAILGGMLTVLGTSSNLIVAGFLRERGLPELGVFDFTPIGLLVLLVAVAYMLTAGRRLLPAYPREQRLRQARLPRELAELYQVGTTLQELRIEPGSPLAGLSLLESNLGDQHRIHVAAISRGPATITAPGPTERLLAGDRLIVSGDPALLLELCDSHGASLRPLRGEAADKLVSTQVGLNEAAVSPRSSLDGRTLREVRFRERYGVTVLGLWRGGKAMFSGLGEAPLRVGDALLLLGPWRQFEALQHDPDLILLNGIERPPVTARAPLAVALLAAALAPALLGWMPLSLAALAGGLAMVLTGCLRVDDAYRAIEWKVIFLMAGMLPLGLAMQKTGAAEWIARGTLGPLADLGAAPLLTAIFLSSMALGLTTSNAAAAILMAPIALGAGLETGTDPRVLMLAVAYGASTAFLTPIANQSNVLVMGPGGYRFADFVRVGGPLTLLAAIVVALALSALW